MNITLDQLFEYSYVITINDKRFNLLTDIFKRCGLPLPKKWEGITLVNRRNLDELDFRRHEMLNVYCGMSHLSLLKMAKEMDFPFVCVFEDDAYPCIDIKKKLEYYLTDIPDNCKYLVLGNCGLGEAGKFKNDKYFEMKTRAGAHAYIVFKNGYDQCIDSFQQWSIWADRVIEKMDNVLSPINNLFIQYANQDCIHKDVGYTWYGRTQEQILKEFPKIEDVLKNDKL